MDTTYTHKRYPETPTELLKSLNGFEELAIKRAFEGMGIGDMVERDKSRFGRGLLFAAIRRDKLAMGIPQGEADAQAYQEAMLATMEQVTEAFEDEPDEPVPSEPRSEVGKDS